VILELPQILAGPYWSHWVEVIGMTGDKGVNGAVGDIGLTGITGAKGDTGLTGTNGAKGILEQTGQPVEMEAT
jgi:hypothetical protein